MTADKVSRTRLRRGANQAVDDQQLIHEIIDQNLICHVGFIADGNPVVIPTCHWRIENRLYWHSHRLGANVAPNHRSEVCITITQLDGLVLARSAFNHSVNYLSVMAFGAAVPVTDAAEKIVILERMMDKFSPERWPTLRPVTDAELQATGVSYITLDELSCKVSRGDAEDNSADIDWPVWAGVLPIYAQLGAAKPNADLHGSHSTPRPPILAGSPSSDLSDNR
ncbi:pyridoxamine 5'-phosphate oxidase family protein [bacterium]|nr:pyridoxamine 5'-phosphate oxidase family protein [bacterium]